MNTDNNNNNKKAKIIKASRTLQSKVGIGPTIDEKLVQESQKIIDANAVDFVPLALQYLETIQKAIDAAKTGKKDGKTALDDMIDPVMQLKANAAMFDYALVSALASVMLNFLETLKSVDKDVIDIVAAHQKTQNLLIGNKMKGNGGPFGQQVVAELKDACKRYFAKQASAGNIIKDDDAFFIEG